MKSGSLPGAAWEKLFPRALALIDEISRYGGIKDPFWTLGRGGTVLMFRYHHRLSKDIVSFMPDPQRAHQDGGDAVSRHGIAAA